MAFGPDSQELLVSTTGGTTSCNRVSDGNPVAQFNVATTGIKFSDDGRSIAMLTPKNLVLFGRATRQSRTPELPTDGRGYVGLSLQATGGKLIVASVSPGSPTQREGRIQVGDELLGIDCQATGRIQSVVGSSVESVAQRIVGTAGSFVALQVLKSGMPDATVIKLQRSAVRDKNGAREFIIAPKGQSEDMPVAVVRQEHVELYSTRSAKAIGTIWPKDAKSHLLVTASPDGHLVSIAGSEPKSGPIVEIHDTRTRSHVCSIPVHVSRCHAVQFTSDGHSNLILDDTRVVKIDVEAQKAALAMNHEGMIDHRSNPEIYFVDSNQIVSQLTLELFGGGSRWRLLRANPNSALASYYAGIRRLTSMAVNPQGMIAIGTNNGEAHLLDVETCTYLAQLGQTSDDGVEMTDLSHDGQWAALYSNGVLSIINIADKAKSQQFCRDIVRENESDGTVLLTSLRGAFKARFPSRPRCDVAAKAVPCDNAHRVRSLKSFGWSSSQKQLRSPTTPAS